MLAKLLGSRLRAKVLGWFFTHPGERYFVRQLTGLLDEDSTNLSRELSRLAGMGILSCRQEGRQKYYEADPRCPVFAELRGLAVKTFGLGDEIRAALATLAPKIRVAFLFGSMVTGQAGTGSDVDVLVVGDVAFAEVVSSLRSAQEKIGREVNPSVYPPEELRGKLADGQHFLNAVLMGPKVFVVGDIDELERVAGQRLGERTPDESAGDQGPAGGG
ncbi:MAG: winged helix-turn-helix domain-containing protein [Planctomycetota bacterium]